jgi:hypothetical protein
MDTHYFIAFLKEIANWLNLAIKNLCLGVMGLFSILGSSEFSNKNEI